MVDALREGRESRRREHAFLVDGLGMMLLVLHTRERAMSVAVVSAYFLNRACGRDLKCRACPSVFAFPLFHPVTNACPMQVSLNVRTCFHLAAY